ncbi:type II toxin-antitoxin system HipA family toxin [Xanthomonas sacchari]
MPVHERYVMIRLEGADQDVPAGLLTLVETHAASVGSRFAYGMRYSSRPGAIDVDPRSLRLDEVAPGIEVAPPSDLALFGAIRDALPDAWGRRVLANTLRIQEGQLNDRVLIDNSSPNRSGALDFRRRPEDAPHDSGLLRPMHLDHLLDAAERIEEGESVPQHLLELLGEAPTLGGMRPKAVLVDQGRQWLAKFPTRRDPFDIPLIEHATLELARLAKMDVPDTRLIDVPGRGTVMMIARFDRGTEAEGYRKWHMVSALTALGVHEMDSPKMAYADIADALGRLGAAGQVTADRHELFRRMVFNILVCNDDDHLRNHALVHRGDFGGWRLSPLYDVVPRPSGGSERFLHLGIGAQGRLSTLDNALTHCARFALTTAAAAAVIDEVAGVVREWKGHFEAQGVPGSQIDKVQNAFRRPSQIGLAQVNRFL